MRSKVLFSSVATCLAFAACGNGGTATTPQTGGAPATGGQQTGSGGATVGTGGSPGSGGT